MNYTYLLRCADGTLYCGWTNDLGRRLKAHNAGRGSKYTRTRTPVTLLWYEPFDTKEEAMSREYHIKRMTRNQKLKLTESFSDSYDMEGGLPGERNEDEGDEKAAGRSPAALPADDRRHGGESDADGG